MDPALLQILLQGGKKLAPHLIPLGGMAGAGFLNGLYGNSGLPGSQRDPRFPDVPSPLEDWTNYAFLASNVIPIGTMAKPVQALTAGLTPFNPLLQELWDKNAQRKRYEKNKYYADEYAQSLKDEKQGNEDWAHLSKVTSDRQNAVIKLIADMRSRGATTDQIKKAISTRPDVTTPGDILRGSMNWTGQFPAGFRSNSVMRNNYQLVRDR